jgi:hypothetical protein
MYTSTAEPNLIGCGDRYSEGGTCGVSLRDPDIMLPEKMRVRQRPMVVYADNIKRLIPPLLPKSIRGAARKNRRPPGQTKVRQLLSPHGPLTAPAIRLDDFSWEALWSGAWICSPQQRGSELTTGCPVTPKSCAECVSSRGTSVCS